VKILTKSRDQKEARGTKGEDLGQVEVLEKGASSG